MINSKQGNFTFIYPLFYFGSLYNFCLIESIRKPPIHPEVHLSAASAVKGLRTTAAS